MAQNDWLILLAQIKRPTMPIDAWHTNTRAQFSCDFLHKRQRQNRLFAGIFLPLPLWISVVHLKRLARWTLRARARTRSFTLAPLEWFSSKKKSYRRRRRRAIFSVCSKRQIDQSEIEMTDGWITDDGNDSEEDKKMKNRKEAAV